MSDASLRLERDGEILHVILADPGRANALSPALAVALTETYERDWRAEGVRALLLSAEGKAFCAGADLVQIESMLEASLDENRAESAKLRRLFEAILRQEALTVALVQGWCVAGGCGIATACDFVFAADNAKFLYSEVKIGFVAALVATYLPLRVRGSHLRELLLDPEPIAAEAAAAMGLANRVVPAAELAAAGREYALSVLSRASSESIARTKRLLLAALGQPLEVALDLAVEANAAARGTEDCRHGIRHFLREKKTPDWRAPR